MKHKLTNKILIPVFAAVFAFLAMLAYLIPHISGGTDGATVKIYRGTEVIKEIELSKVSESYEIDIQTNRVLVEKDGVAMTHAKCPDKLCVHQGKIQNPGESIVCLPNRIMIEIVGKNSKVDAVAGAR